MQTAFFNITFSGLAVGLVSIFGLDFGLLFLCLQGVQFIRRALCDLYLYVFLARSDDEFNEQGEGDTS